MKRGATAAVMASLIYSGFAVAGKAGAQDAATVASDGALVAAEAYVADRKRRYANVRDRIAGERSIIAAATDSAYAEIGASQIRIKELDQQVASLSASRQSRTRTAQQLSATLASLDRREKRLAMQRTGFEQMIRSSRCLQTRCLVGNGMAITRVQRDLPPGVPIF